MPYDTLAFGIKNAFIPLNLPHLVYRVMYMPLGGCYQHGDEFRVSSHERIL